MGKHGYLRMRTDQQASDLIGSDLQELSLAAKKLVNHAIRLGSLGFGTTFLEWVASFAAMYVAGSFSLPSPELNSRYSVLISNFSVFVLSGGAVTCLVSTFPCVQKLKEGRSGKV